MIVTVAPKKGSLLTAYSHDPALRAEWEREERAARKRALRKVDELEQFYRGIPEDGLDWKRRPEAALGRDLVLKSIPFVREALEGGTPWRPELDELKRLHDRVILSLARETVAGVCAQRHQAAFREAQLDVHRQERQEKEADVREAVAQIMKSRGLRYPSDYSAILDALARRWGESRRNMQRYYPTPNPRKKKTKTS